MATVLRPLSTSELLDRTFHLYRNHFLLFVGIAAMPQILVLGLQLGDSALLATKLIDWVLIATFVIAIVNWLAIEASHAGTVIAVSNIQLDKPAGIGSAYSSTWRSLPRVILISFLFVFVPAIIAGLIAAVIIAAVAVPLAFLSHGSMGNLTMIRIISGVAALGVFLLVIPIGLRWWLAWALSIPVTIVEGKGTLASFRRSKELTKGSKGRIFLIGLLMVGLTWLVSTFLQLPILLVAGLRAVRDPMSAGPILHVVQSACAFVSISLVGPLLTIALTLVYYDQRVRKEGFDLQLMMAALQPGSALPGSEPAAAAAAPNS